MAIAGPYLALSVCWIVASDWVASRLTDEPELQTAQTLKGLAFVILSSGLIYALARRQLRLQSEREVAAEELARTAERYHRAQEVASVGSWEVDLTSETLTWSDEVFHIFGIDRDAFAGTEEAFFAMVHPDDREPLQQARAAFIEGPAELDEEHRIVRPDGEVRWVHERATVVRDQDGEPRFTTGTVQDITRRKTLERELSLSLARLDAALAACPLPVMILAADGEVIEWNRAAEEVLGWTRDEVLGRSDPVAIEGEPPRGTAQLGTRTRARRADGSMLDAEIWEAPWSNVDEGSDGDEGSNADEGRVRVLIDLTERMRLERRLEEHARRTAALSSQLLQAQEDERRRLARELHDELGQSLTLIHLQLQRAREASAESPWIPRLLESVGSALEGVRAMSLALRPPMLDDLGLIAALRWLVERYQGLDGVRVDLRCSIDETDVPEHLRVPAYRMVQEALTNALRHADAEEIRVSVSRADAELVVRVEDDGSGFDVDEAFERATDGHSLGLLSMQERVEAQGGRVCLTSSSEMGTTVEVRLPEGSSRGLRSAANGW